MHQLATTMQRDELKTLIRARPFQPFTIHLPEGRHVPVVHHDFALLAPDGRTLWVYQSDRSCDMIDVMLIARIHLDAIPEAPIPPWVNGPPVA
ncbi:MAG TPA: hypothetical protein VKE40_07645 [Gemmataceae bacterium]|nr:hypothetical protein [Gemmataceae bacterium]